MIRIGDKPARPSGLKTAADRGQGPLRAGRGDRPLRLLRQGQAVGERGRRLRRGGRVRDARPRRGPPARATRCCSPQGLGPGATREALREHEKPNIYVLGPESRDLEDGGERPRQAREGAPDRGRRTRAERDRLRPLRARRLRLGGGRARATTSRSRAPRGRSTPRRGGRSPPRASSRRCCSPTAPTSCRARSRTTSSASSPASRTTPARRSTTASGSSATTRRCRWTPRRGWTRSPS